MTEDNMSLSVVDKCLLPVKCKAHGDNYDIQVPNGTLRLVRDIDFGRIPNTTKPCLFKSGAERILFSLGLMPRYTVEEAIENWDSEAPFFFYRVKCTLYAMVNGKEVAITDGMGSANTMEKSCGRALPYDTANARLKIAKKRAMVDACLLVGQLSNAFAQDIESDDVINAKIDNTSSEEDYITTPQIKRIYTIAGQAGYKTAEVKRMLKDAGYESTKSIKQKDYDAVCELFAEKKEVANAD